MLSERNSFVCRGLTVYFNKKKKMTALVIMEMQIKTTMRCHFTHTRMAIIKIQIITIVDKDVETLEPWTLLVGM